jgi:apolipoprotein N-acyltransferase
LKVVGKMLQKVASDIILSWGWRRYLIAFFAGLILNLALPPFDFFAVGFISFPILLWLLEGATPASTTKGIFRSLPAAFVGWWFGFGYFLGGLWWLGNAILTAEGIIFLGLPLAVLGLPAVLALFFAGAAMVFYWLGGVGIGTAASLAFSIGLTEWLRGFLLSGFPWNGVGMTLMPTPLLMQSASILGIVGMNSIAVFLFSLPACFFLVTQWRWFGVVLSFALLSVHIGFGVIVLHNSTQTHTSLAKIARIVQPSINQTEKWDEGKQTRIFETFLKMSAQEPEAGKPVPSLIIWPETAVPFIFTDRPEALTQIGKMLKSDQILLTGTVRQEGMGENGDKPLYYNSVVGINSNGEIIDAADKVHLVPFGEYLPFEALLKQFGISQLAETFGGFTAGSRRNLLQFPHLPTIMPLICYEIIFPNALETEEKRPQLIVNFTNDAWYGNTPGPYQHLRLAQIRATESGIPIIRSANNGISAFIDSHGQIESALRLDEISNLDMPINVHHFRTIYSNDGKKTIFFTYCVFLALIGLTNWRQKSKVKKSVL